MENFQTIIFILSLLIISSLAIALIFKYKEANKLKDQLEKIRGKSEDELFNRGKCTELGLLSAGITHEISNPLSIILGRVTQLSRFDVAPDKKSEFEKGLLQIKNNADRIALIIQRFRDYIYRNDERTEDFISLTEIINGVLMFYGQRLINHGIELRIKNVEDLYISGHKGEFEQAFLNLISNSFDAVDKLDEKWIEISAVKKADNVQIYIKDSGHGIPVEVRRKMLDLFFTTKNKKGSGLGLSLVKGIAQKHGGDLKYIEDEHTTFMIELPKASSLQYHH